MYNRVDAKQDKFIKTMTGRVQRFEGSFGFIRADDPTLNDVFVHYLDIEPNTEGFKKLYEQDVVKFDLYRGPRGLKAVNVEVLRDPPPLSKFKTAAENLENQKHG